MRHGIFGPDDLNENYWFEEYLKNPNFHLDGIGEDSVTFNVTKPQPFVYVPRETFNYTKPVDPNLWFNLEADLMGKTVTVYEVPYDVENENMITYDIVYAKPRDYVWLD